MREKQPNASAIETKTPKRSPKERLASCAGRIALGAVVTEAIIGGITVYGMDDPTIGKATEATIRTNQALYYVLSQQDSCPPASDPADIQVLNEAVAHSNESAKAIAERNNIELFAMEPLYDRIEDLQAASSYQEVTDIINNFTQQHMNLTIDAEHIYENSKIEVSDYKDRIWSFMMIMRDIPKTLLDKIEIEDIIILAENDSEYGMYDGTTREVRLNINALDSSKTVLHEIVGHGVHNTVCSGSFFNDRSFAAHNPSSQPYTGNNWSATRPSGDSYVSSYATKTVSEDYAETTECYLTGQIPTNLIGTQSPLDKKVAQVLTRLDQLVPGIDKYLTRRIPDFRSYEAHHKHRIDESATADKK